VTPRTPGARIVEVKRSFDGAREQRFDCELVEANRARAVVLFRLEREGVALDSYGFFWVRRPYNCYYAVRAGTVDSVFVRCDVVTDVQIGLAATPPEVRYRDLLLDLWLDHAGPRWDDEADVAAAIETGAMTEADARRVARARALLEGGRSRIIGAVRREVMRLAAAR